MSTPAVPASSSSSLSFSGREDLFGLRSRLRDRKTQLAVESRELAFAHYPTFIAAAETCKEIAAQFKDNQEHLQKAINTIPKLQERCG